MIGTDDGTRLNQPAKQFTNPHWRALCLRLRAQQATLGNRLDAGQDSRRLRNLLAGWLSLSGFPAGQTSDEAIAWISVLAGELACQADPATETLAMTCTRLSVAARSGGVTTGMAV